MYERILVTLDGSKTSEAVLPEVERVARGHEVSVILLTVAETPRSTAEAPHPLVVAGMVTPGGVRPAPAPRVVEDRGQALAHVQDELHAYLEEKARPLRELGLIVETEVAFGEPVEEILALARQRGADLVMMTTHGRTGVAQAIFGSVASRVVGSGVRPVLLVRPDHLREAKG